MNNVVIGVGSNIQPGKNIPKMLDLLKMKVEVIRVSTLVKTKPIGIKDQPDYINGAVMINTDLDQANLKKVLKDIEILLGRDPAAHKFGPRCIDLDIIVWNGEIVDLDYYSRDFLKKSVQEVLNADAVN